MRRTRPLSGLLPLMLLLLPVATMAQNTPPDRLNGTFDFVDRDQPANNSLQFVIEDDRSSATGMVWGNAGGDVVRISWTTMYPNSLKANHRTASVSQDREVMIELELVPGMMSATPAYLGTAAPRKCKASAKIQDPQANDPDEPNKSDGKVKCDLGRDFGELDDGGFGPPPPAVLQAVEDAFDPRKDVRVQTSNGTLKIKHKGEPAP